MRRQGQSVDGRCLLAYTVFSSCRASCSLHGNRLAATAFNYRYGVHTDGILLLFNCLLFSDFGSQSRCSFFFLFLRQCGQILHLGDALDFDPLRVLLRHVVHVELLLVEDFAFRAHREVHWLRLVHRDVHPLRLV